MTIWRVRAPIAAAMTRGEGVYPSSQKWCSVSHTDRNPRLSAQAIWSRVAAYSASELWCHCSGFRKS